MKKFRFINFLLLSMIIAITMVIATHLQAQAQALPVSYYYTSPLAFPTYGYFNTIDGYLLGYNTFNPFLAPEVADTYALAGIPVYGYLTNPYSTTYPYATLNVSAPYAPAPYPTFTYGSADIYSLWVDLNL